LGVAAAQMEHKGIRTERGNSNREIEVTNKELRQIKARLDKLNTWLKEEMENDEPPTLRDVVFNILKGREQTGQQSQSQKLYNLKAAANIHAFLMQHDITDMAGLDGKLKGMIGKQDSIRAKLKKNQRRKTTLDEHIRHGGNYKAYRGKKAQYEKLYAEYRAIKKAGGFLSERKAQKALDAANDYHETYRPQIAMYDSAVEYLQKVMQGHFDPKKLPPMKKWEAERGELAAERAELNREYATLKTETAAVEKIRKNVQEIISEERPTTERTKAHGMEL
jgi:hypothetical protein